MRMKRASWCLVIIIMVLTIALLSMPACSKDQTTASPAGVNSAPNTTASTPAAAAAPAAKVKELSLACHSPPGHYFNVTMAEWGQQISDKTGGAIKITLYPSESLSRVTDVMKSVKGGIADIGWLLGGMSPGATPLSDLYGLPRVGSPNRDYVTADKIFDKYLSTTEFKDLKVVAINVLGPNFLHTTKKQVKTLADLKGLQIRAQGGGRDAWIKAAGGTPVIVPSPEVYTSLERGMIDGALMTLENAKSTKVQDVCKFQTNIGDTCNPSFIIMNLGVWNTLSPDIQKIFTDLRPVLEKTLVEKAETFDASAEDAFKQSGSQFTALSTEDMATWDAAFAPVISAKIADVDAKGLPGTAMVNEIRSLSPLK
jgi:TRAP-type transport system periplasmic protein